MHTSLYKIKKLESHGRPQGFLLLRAEFTALYALMAVTCVVSYWAWGDPHVRLYRYAYDCSRVLEGELYRHFTSGFLHADKGHLYGTMKSLLLFGLIVCYRTKMSNIKFLFFYFSALIFTSYFEHLHKMSYLSVSDISLCVGASGGSHAIKFAAYLLIFSPRRTKNSALKQMLSVVLFFYFFTDIYNDFTPSQVYVSYAAHFGGGLYGTAFALFYYPGRVFAGFFARKKAPSAT